MIYISKNTLDTEKYAASIAKKFMPPRTFCLKGELGAGKTAFTRGLAAGYGYQGRVTSPTFTVMNIYKGNSEIHHFDLYRLSCEEELFDIGFEPSENGIITIVEWFDDYVHLFDKGDVLVSIDKDCSDENIRIISITDMEGKEILP